MNIYGLYLGPIPNICDMVEDNPEMLINVTNNFTYIKYAIIDVLFYCYFYLTTHTSICNVFPMVTSIYLFQLSFFSIHPSIANFPTVSISRAQTSKVGEGLIVFSLLYNFPERVLRYQRISQIKSIPFWITCRLASQGKHGSKAVTMKLPSSRWWCPSHFESGPKWSPSV